MELMRYACKRHFVVCSRLVLRSRDGACSTHSSVSRLFGKPLPSVESSAEDAVDGSLAPPPTHAPSQLEVPDDTAIRERYSSAQPQPEEWMDLKLSLSRLPLIYLSLAKYRVTTLVSLTALIGYTLAPAPFHLPTVLLATAGTALCSAGAMAFNHWVEVPYDSQMARTRNRVLVKGLISPLHAVVYGVSAGLAGTALLWYTVNPLTAVLGFGNLLLYSSCYTPLKRISIANTWVGALVGAIPPLMGWTACTGSLDTGAFVLAGVLYAWQFPHFNALSWRLRGDYSRAGYRMMSVLNPGLCKRTSLRYSISLLPICTMAPVLDITTWWFVLDSLPVNGWLVYLSWRFYRDSDFKSARKLFHFTLFHLPLLMGLILINKKHWNSAEMAAQKPPTTTASYSTFDTSLS